MIKTRPRDDRGRTQLDWLDSRHSFSFGDYNDPDHMGFRSLRVINDDVVQPGKGFGTHSHRDMEIVTLVLEGGLEHKDSTGTSSVIRPGDVQRMSAGTGVTHSEYNPSRTEPVHLLQIWILPERTGLPPSYEQRTFSEAERRGLLRLIASRNGRDGSVTIHQDADVYATLLEPRAEVVHRLRPGRHAWVQVARGAVGLDDHRLEAGDGAAVSEESALRIAAAAPTEVLVFDLP